MFYDVQMIITFFNIRLIEKCVKYVKQDMAKYILYIV